MQISRICQFQVADFFVAFIFLSPFLLCSFLLILLILVQCGSGRSVAPIKAGFVARVGRRNTGT